MMGRPAARKLFLGLVWVAALLPLSCQPRTEAPPARPNFVFILVDDLGWTDVGAFGSSFYETPNIDRLAATGMKFTQAYAASSVCSPTRSSILTGKNPGRTKHTQYFGAPQPGEMNETHPAWKGAHRKLEPAEYLPYLEHADTTIAEALKEAGYKTFFAGKWHLGAETHYPETHGFDINKGGTHRGGPYGGKKYFSPYDNPSLPDGPEGEHLPDRLATETARFIEANKDSAFFAYLSFYSVHTPLMARPDLEEKYRSKRDSLALTDEWEPWGPHPDNRTRMNQSHAVYAAMVEAMDQAVGKVMDKLEELGLAENTVIIFMSDNGGLSTAEGHPTCNLPLRAGKGWAYEGGIREPLIVRWPKEVKANAVCDVPVISTDFYPTMLQMAGLLLKPAQHLDGSSFLPLLKQQTDQHQTLLLWHYPHYANQGETPYSAIRKGDWKLIYRYEDGTDELFNIAQDIGERNNLVGQHPEKAFELRKQMDEWLYGVGARFPTSNPNFGQ